jgi:tRNA A37 threonylcarbamoyltransferase TsaD
MKSKLKMFEEEIAKMPKGQPKKVSELFLEIEKVLNNNDFDIKMSTLSTAMLNAIMEYSDDTNEARSHAAIVSYNLVWGIQMAANAIKEAMKEHDEGQELDDEFHTQMMKH